MKPEDHALDNLVAEYLELIDSGQPPNLDAFLRGREQYRDELLRFLQLSGGIDRLTRLGQSPVHSSREPTTVTTSNTLDSRLRVGHYVLREMIARGGMGTIYRAEDVSTGDAVAIKLLRAVVSSQPNYQQRFQREVRAISSLHHPYVVPLHDFGTDDGCAYLAMQLIDGVGLDCVIAQRRETQRRTGDALSQTRTPVSKSKVSICAPSASPSEYFAGVAECLANIAEALQAAHQTGMTHRDVKPSNILLDVHGKAWLTDFGLASLGEEVTQLTATGDVLGTPCYMSPEQAIGDSRRLDHRVDVYGLGATLYELATLRKPFLGSRDKVLCDVAEGKLERPTKVNPEVPAQLEAIIVRAMATSPRDRYTTAREMSADLRRFASGKPVTAKFPSRTVRFLRWCELNPRLTLSTAVGLLLVVGCAFAVQAWNESSLRELNSRLEVSNHDLSITNQKLEASQQRLGRELYVADLSAAFEVYNQRNIPAARMLIDRYRSPVDGHDSRGTGWKLLDQLTRTPTSQTLVQHDGSATEICVAPGGAFALSCGHDGRVARFSLDDESQQRVFEIGDQLDALAIGVSGDFFLTGKNVPDGYNRLHAYSPESGEVIGGEVKLWRSIESIATSPSGKWFATAERYDYAVVHDRHGKLRGKWQTGSRNESLAFVDDDRLLGVIQQSDRSRHLEVWTIDSEQTRRVECPFGVEYFALARPNATDPPSFAAAASANSVCLLAGPNFDVVAAQENIAGRIRCLDISSDGRIVIAGCDEGSVFVWEIDQRTSKRKGFEVRKVLQVSDHRVTDVLLLEQASSQANVTVNAQGSERRSIEFLTAADDGRVRRWTLPPANPQACQTLADTTTGDFNPPYRDAKNNRLIIPYEDGSLVELDAQTLDARKICSLNQEPRGHVTLGPRGERIFVAVRDGVAEVQRDSGELLRILPAEKGDQRCEGLVARDDQLLACYNDHVITFDLSTGRQVSSIRLPTDSTISMTPIPGSSSVMVVTYRAIYRLVGDRLEVVEESPSRGLDYSSASFSADGRLLAVSHHNHLIRVLDAEGNEVATLSGHTEEVSDLQFLDGRQVLLSSSFDDTLRFWDLTTGRALGVLRTPVQDPHHIDHFPTLQRLFTAHPHGKLFCWKFDE